MRRVLIAFVAIAATTVLAAGPAGAGEITGNGKQTPIKSQQDCDFGGECPAPAGPANSFCAFSGQNDDPDAPGDEGGRTQSFGVDGPASVTPEEVVFFATTGLIREIGPGTECRGGFPTLGQH